MLQKHEKPFGCMLLHRMQDIVIIIMISNVWCCKCFGAKMHKSSTYAELLVLLCTWGDVEQREDECNAVHAHLGGSDTNKQTFVLIFRRGRRRHRQKMTTSSLSTMMIIQSTFIHWGMIRRRIIFPLDRSSSPQYKL